MRFLPKNLKQNTEKVLEIMQRLKEGQVFALLDFLSDNSWDSPTAKLLAENILFEKEALSWVFESESTEQCFFHGSFSPENHHVRLLRNRFLFARKLKDYSHKEQCYYARNGEILWNLLFSDLISLDIDRKSHLFLNLKNYLDFGHYDKALKNPELLSKIFYLYYNSLKGCSNIPAHFLLECLKIVRILNPSHSPAAIEYSQKMESQNRVAEAFELIDNLYRKGCRDAELIVRLIELSNKSDKKLETQQLAEQVYQQKLTNMKAEHLLAISNILYENQDYTASLFFHLKAIGKQNKEEKNYSDLGRIFFQLNDFATGVFCYESCQLSCQKHQDVIFIIPTELQNRVKYKFSALESWQKIIDNFVFAPKVGSKAHIHFQLLANQQELYFCTDHIGPYQLSLKNDAIHVEAVPSSALRQNYRQYKYCENSFCADSNSLFHILETPLEAPLETPIQS